MPNCDFYATPQDHEGILSWLFDDGACEVYESYSRYGLELRRLRSTSEVLDKFEERYVTGDRVTSVLLDLYVVGAGPPFVARHIELNPKSCGGATFRYAADGWGLVQLQLNAQNVKKGLENSHTNHNTRKRAEAWAATPEERAAVAEWDFARVTSFSSRLNREIRKRAVGKIGSRVVLPEAFKLWEAGVSLVPFSSNTTELELIPKNNQSSD